MILSHFQKKLAELGNQLVISSNTVWSLKIDLKTDKDKLIFNAIRVVPPTLQQVKKDPDLIYAVILSRNFEVLDETRSLVQNLLSDMIRHLSSPDLQSSNEFHLEMIMGDLLAQYPYLMPKEVK